jgi:hypothetical protein
MYCCTVMVREKVTAGWTNCMGSRDSSVGIVLELWFGQSGFRFSSDARDFSSLKRPGRLAPPPRNYYPHMGIDRENVTFYDKLFSFYTTPDVSTIYNTLDVISVADHVSIVIRLDLCLIVHHQCR